MSDKIIIFKQTRHRVGSRSRLRLLALLLTLVIGYVFMQTSISRAQTSSTTYGCLEIFKGGLQGRYDLDRGVYTDLSATGTPQAPPPTNSSTTAYTASINDAGQFVIVSNQNKPIQTIDLPKEFQQTQQPFWSPDKRYVAQVGEVSDKNSLLIIASPAKGLVQKFEIANLTDYTIPFFEWSPDSRNVILPIDQNFLGKDSAYYTVSIEFYGIDGRFQQIAQKAVGYIQCGETCDSHDYYEWSADGKTMYYVQLSEGSKTFYDVKAYQQDANLTITLARQVSDFPLYDSRYQHALIQWQTEGKTYAGILDTQTTKTVTLGSRDGKVDVKWIGDRVLIRWDTVLLWANLDGSELHSVDVAPDYLVNGPDSKAFWLQQSYDVSPDGRWLVVTTTPNTDAQIGEIATASVRIIDLNSGKVRTVNHLIIPITLIDGLAISPDSKFIVLVGDGLYLLRLEDGKVQQVKFDPDATPSNWEIHQLVWLPDNRHLVIVYPAYMPDSPLDLVDIDGKVIRHYDNFPAFGEPVVFFTAWSPCPS